MASKEWWTGETESSKAAIATEDRAVKYPKMSPVRRDAKQEKRSRAGRATPLEPGERKRLERRRLSGKELHKARTRRRRRLRRARSPEKSSNSQKGTRGERQDE